jgi:hypothetical protein
LQTAQFIRGKIDGIQKSFESSNLGKILPQEKLSELADYTEIGEYPRFFKTEKVLTKTVVSAAENSDGRRGGIINHTVLYKWDQTLIHEDAPYIFDLDTFIAEILAGKRRFKMPNKPELPKGDSGFIETPPLEWEVY